MNENTKRFMSGIKATLNDYITGRKRAKDCVRTIDDLMADMIPDDLPKEISDVVHALHNELALYVEDPRRRAEDPAYIGDERFRQVVEQFLERC
jgi:hypothetical protein